MCNCMQEIKDQLKEEAKREGLTRVSVSAPVDIFDGDKVPQLEFRVTFNKVRNNGKPYRNRTGKVKMIKCKYCPICGELISK